LGIQLEGSQVDLISGFKSELFRPLAILVVPGSFAVAPFALLLAKHNEEIGNFLITSGLGFFAIFLVVSTAAGLVLENVGARIERGIDWCLNDRYLPRHWDQWGAYLELKTDSEIVANRYLRTVVVRAKFAFAFVPALISFIVGLWLLQCDQEIWTYRSIIITTIVLLALICVLYVEGVRLSEVMAEARCRVLASHGHPCAIDEMTWPGMRVFVAYSFLNFVGRHPLRASEIVSEWFPLKVPRRLTFLRPSRSARRVQCPPRRPVKVVGEEG
jgi:hypothetical protein